MTAGNEWNPMDNAKPRRARPQNFDTPGSRLVRMVAAAESERDEARRELRATEERAEAAETEVERARDVVTLAAGFVEAAAGGEAWGRRRAKEWARRFAEALRPVDAHEADEGAGF